LNVTVITHLEPNVGLKWNGYAFAWGESRNNATLGWRKRTSKHMKPISKIRLILIKNKFCQPLVTPLSRFQTHLKSKAKFLWYRDPKPRPPRDFDLMTLYKATLQIPWEFKLPLHKKEWLIEDMTLIIPFGIW